MELAKVTSKGQVTIPAAIRKLLGIQEIKFCLLRKGRRSLW